MLTASRWQSALERPILVRGALPWKRGWTVENDASSHEPAAPADVPRAALRSVASATNPFAELGRYLYTNNPFYLVSAGLVLTGLGQGFRAESDAYDPWLLGGALLAYTLLMTLASLAVIRGGKVWDDGRTMVLIVVFLLCIQPIALDRILLNESFRGGDTGGWLMVACLMVAVALSETLLIGLQLGLGAVFRVPYYLLMSLFFLYPIALQKTLEEWGPLPARWAIFAFPSLAAVVTLTLLPLAWQAQRSISRSRSPWPWPYFPWSVFVFLGVGVIIRTFMLAISFDPAKEEGTAFALYWLVPFAFAVLVVVFEAGRAARSEWAVHFATVTACVVPVMACEFGPWISSVSASFSRASTEVLGPPPLLALAGLTLFLFMAWRRGVQWAEGAMMVALLVLTVAGRWTTAEITWAPPRAWPLATLALMQLVAGRWTSWRVLMAGLAGSAALLLTWPVDLPGSGAMRAAACVNACLIFVVIVSVVFKDDLVWYLRWLVSIAASAAGALAMTASLSGAGLGQWLPPIPVAWAAGYVLCWLAAFTLLGYWSRSWSFWCGAAGQGLVLVTSGGIGLFRLTRGTALEAGADAIAAGLVIFVVAAGISLMKARRLSSSSG